LTLEGRPIDLDVDSPPDSTAHGPGGQDLEVRASGASMPVRVLARGGQAAGHRIAVGNRVLRVELSPPLNGIATAWVNGRALRVGMESELERRARPARRTATSGTRAIAAPMPGRVVRVLVSAGDSVDTGTPLLGIEAMKMENQLSASAPGVVARVLVDVGDTVEANQQLMVIDPAPEPRE
jgi:biotin carboxyl carrier protein